MPTPLMENRFAKKSLAERGGTPPPLTPLTERHCAQKSLAEWGGTPSPPP